MITVPAWVLRIPAEWPIMLAAQIPEQPQSLVTLQWIIIVALGGAVSILYRQLLVERDKRIEERKQSEDKYVALLEKSLAALSGNTAALEGIDERMEAETAAKSMLERLRTIEGRLLEHAKQ